MFSSYVNGYILFMNYVFIIITLSYVMFFPSMQAISFIFQAKGLSSTSDQSEHLNTLGAQVSC